MRLLYALYYYAVGWMIGAAKPLEKHPMVIEARFDSMLGKYRARLAVVKDAVGGIVALREQRKMDLERLNAQKAECEETMGGAEALATEVAARLKKAGKSDVEVQEDPQFKEYSAAYADAESSLQNVLGSIERVQRDIANYEQQANDHILKLQEMQREMKTIEGEKYETLVDVALSTQEKELNDMVSGFATDGIAKERQDLRDIRTKARGDAEVSRRLSGADVKLQQARLRAAGHASRAGLKLAAKLGLGVAQATEKPVAAAPAKEAATGTGGKPPGGLPG